MPKGHPRAAHSRRRGVALAATAVAMVLALGAVASGAEAATFKVTKLTDPAGDATPFTFHVTFTPQPNDTPPPDFKVPADFTLMGGQSKTFTVHKGFYTITELSLAGWRLVHITCDNGGDTDPADAPKIDVGAAKATLELSATEHKGCTFENAKVPPPLGPPPSTPPSTPPSSASPPPAQQSTPPAQQNVAGAQVARSSAALVGPRRCVSRRFTVAVTAGRARTVSFFVNGQRFRTLTARTGQRRFSVQLPRPAAVAHVVVVVRFQPNTTPATRTLRTTVRRCAQQAVQPQFTG
jgi:hypothetical protein